MLFDVLTLFPGLFESFLSESVLKKALDDKKIGVRLFNMRDWATDKHRKMDDRPFGGGPGMVLKVDCVVPCVEDILHKNIPGSCCDKTRLILLTPQGRVFNQRLAEEFAEADRLVLMCGRYEGFDERVVEILKPEEISIGDYVLNGGEVAAMAIIESVMRLLPGVLGDDDSSRFDSFSSGNRLLDCAQYTRPREFRDLDVPEVLLNGHHAEIEQWRHENSRERTLKRKPWLVGENNDE